MLRLQDVFEDIDLLKEIDLISSVSGGSLPAAYYCISMDPGATKGAVKSNRLWDNSTVKRLMARNYLYKWIGNWF